MEMHKPINKKIVKIIEEVRKKTTPKWRRTFSVPQNIRRRLKMYLADKRMEQIAIQIKIIAIKPKFQ
jgi:hypothetical protein